MTTNGVAAWPDERLLATFGQGKAFAQQWLAGWAYLFRATDREGLVERWRAAIRAGLPKATADRLAQARARTLGLPTVSPPAPGDYSPTCRADGLPILGADAIERLARLVRFRNAIQAGADERKVNAAINAEYGVIGFELLTGEEADEVLARLERAAVRDGHDGAAESIFAPLERGIPDGGGSPGGDGADLQGVRGDEAARVVPEARRVAVPGADLPPVRDGAGAGAAAGAASGGAAAGEGA